MLKPHTSSVHPPIPQVDRHKRLVHGRLCARPLTTGDSGRGSYTHSNMLR